MNKPSRNPNLDNLLGQFIKQKRLNMGLTQDEIAQYLGISQATISRIEKGRFKITLTDFVRFSKRYAPEIKIKFPKDLSLDDILC